MTSIPAITESSPAGRPVSRLARIGGAVAAVLGGAAWLGTLYFVVARVAPFERIFEKFQVRGGLPELTQTVFDISHPIVYLWPVWAAVIAAVTAALAYLSATARRRMAVAAAIVYGFFSCMACMLAVPIMLQAILGPLGEMMRQAGHS